jgi:hypothetical protein
MSTDLTLDLQAEYAIATISLRNTVNTGTSDFKILVSSDGNDFQTVLNGTVQHALCTILIH